MSWRDGGGDGRDEQSDTLHAVDAERGVLGLLLAQPDQFDELNIAAKLGADDWYDKRHKMIYATFCAEKEKGAEVDVVTIVRRLDAKGELSEIGRGSPEIAEGYIADLIDIGGNPANANAYIDLIVEMSTLRRLRLIFADGLRQVHHLGDSAPGEVTDKVEAQLHEVIMKISGGQGAGGAWLSSLTREYEQEIIDNHSDLSALRGLHPGYDNLNEKTGGFKGGDLVILAGRPGAGKTAFALNVMRRIAQQGGGVLCFSLEMSDKQLAGRMLGQHGLDMHKMLSANSVSAATVAQLTRAARLTQALPIMIDDKGDLNIMQARARARRARREMERNGTPLRFIMVDYLQLMDSSSGGYRNENRAQEVAKISRGLKSLAREMDVPIMALSQLNRGVENRPDRRPVMSDLRESGAIEQDADLILFLHSKDDGQDDDGQSAARKDVTLIIGKQRNGPVGDLQFEFDKPLSLFEEKGRQRSDDPF